MITVSPFSATVDGLFMTLILLTLSACFLLNAFWEARDKGLLKFGRRKRHGDAEARNCNVHAGRKSPAAKVTPDGNPGSNVGASDDSLFRRSHPARVHALVARDRPLLPPARTRHRRARIAAGLLARARLRLRQLFAFRQAEPSSITWITSIPAR